jgi:glyoxylase-like metal-dependent hydrolase (beta-lactamase superfamily II)
MTRHVADAERLAAELGIRRLAIPTPFSVGPVNVYLLDGDPPALIDSGPNLATSLLALEAGLAGCGHRVEDLGLLMVTHLHVDHLGLTAVLAARSGAGVLCLSGAEESARDFDTYARRNDAYAADLMFRHGVEPAVVDALRSVSGLARAYGASFDPTVSIHDGDEIDLVGHRLKAYERPGHSPFDVVLEAPEHRILFTGDHLLSEISSNALLTRPAGRSDPPARPRPLLDYRASLLATRALDCDVALGGHGPAIGDHRALIDERIRHQDLRAERLLEILRAGPASAHELAGKLWGHVAVTEAFLTTSEVLGHLDLLLQAGEIVEHDGQPVRFEVA